MDETSPQARSNACAAYFFLAPLFLLAFANPELSRPFVRGHSLRALSLQLAMAGAWAAFWPLGFLSGVSFGMPVSVGRAVGTLALLAGAAGLFSGVVAASKGRSASVRAALSVPGVENSGLSASAAPAGEAEKSRVALSYVPLVGVFSSAHSSHPAAVTGARFSSLFFLAACLAAPAGDAALSALLLAYAAACAFAVVRLFAFDQAWRWGVLERLPDAESFGLSVRAAGDWLRRALRAAFGAKGEFSYAALRAARSEAEDARDALDARAFPGDSFPGPLWLAYLPVANLFLLPFARKSRYAPALAQGAALSVLFVLAAAFLPFAFAAVLLLPFALGASRSGPLPAYRVPFGYCLSSVFRRLLSRARSAGGAVAAAASDSQSLSLKVGGAR